MKLCKKYMDLSTGDEYIVCGCNDGYIYLDLINNPRLCNMKVVSIAELNCNFIKI